MDESEKKLLKRYYQGGSNLKEERKLKTSFREGKLPEDPILAFRDKTTLPDGLTEKIQKRIHQQATQRIAYWYISTISVAAMLILLISIRGLSPQRELKLQLSDHIKKERFEDALKVIGQVLEEHNTPVQQILYEDNNLIIAVE